MVSSMSALGYISLLSFSAASVILGLPNTSLVAILRMRHDGRLQLACAPHL